MLHTVSAKALHTTDFEQIFVEILTMLGFPLVQLVTAGKSDICF